MGEVAGIIIYATAGLAGLLCNCTPNDLFVWVPDKETSDADSKPLLKLKAKPRVPNPVERIKQLPLEKLQELQQFIDKLEKGE